MKKTNRIPKRFKHNGILFQQFDRKDKVINCQAYWKKDKPLFMVAIVFTVELKNKAGELIIQEFLRENNNKETLWITKDGIEAIEYYNALVEIFPEQEKHEIQDNNNDWCLLKTL